MPARFQGFHSDRCVTLVLTRHLVYTGPGRRFCIPPSRYPLKLPGARIPLSHLFVCILRHRSRQGDAELLGPWLQGWNDRWVKRDPFLDLFCAEPQGPLAREANRRITLLRLIRPAGLGKPVHLPNEILKPAKGLRVKQLKKYRSPPLRWMI